ncbi:beta-fructofuranosidase SUC2 KNAG_0E01410 [Huiozyma naganishii CBS 8797]|uniref:Glycosyl hydrolase family 32 N-terminal domain-containing protein n=1 Tax=Huiozyma naganishii (strain ATCC MYA-139 / BCRC 22969 / CBS 8797 / KCTC 17520 / NBRC 10181 / NCYC 3082 / Yp74L-3) TaxID=1071383 RepID=J7RYY7_HUIN7|nr:hypothetical protein KNAG_0E01410 [Kazachstania naganishii CBS 8797]CCK70407.1 hypothetical protein KNAG_0E01410 [Kazachstania naganishii CBS 8797]
MKLPYLLTTLCTAVGVASSPIKITHANDTVNRPLVHLTPHEGWMNDPNGLWYDAKEELWHVYYQYNPNDTVWGLPLYWGHSTSKNLTLWDDVGVAIEPMANNSGAYSGCMVIDYSNTTGFFGEDVSPEQRVVAIWTYNTPESETQYLSYSLDGGYSFRSYSGNPVLENNSTQFRDPKVMWHEETQKWIMVVAKAQQFKIGIYTSDDLKEWTPVSDFTRGGYLGYQYECPGLVKLPVEGNTSAGNGSWVLFVSINPGSPQGGSSTQYFIGDFNGTHFIPTYENTNSIDSGKDYYALQTFFNSPDNQTYGIAWASNWQYSAFVPTDPWRSSMSLVRKFVLEEFQANPETKLLNIKSTPILDYDALGCAHPSNGKNLFITVGNPLQFSLVQGLFDFNISFSVNGSAFGGHEFADLSLYLRGGENKDEYLRIGFGANAATFFIDRGHTAVNWVHENPFFTDKMSVNNQPLTISNNSTISTYSVRGIVDRNILELYFNNGSQVSTNTFFFTGGNFIGSIDMAVGKDNVFNVTEFSLKQLSTGSH